MASRRLVLKVAAAVVAVDATAKTIAVATLEGRAAVDLPAGLGRMWLYRNPGGPGGLLEQHTLLVTVAALCIVAWAWILSRQAATPRTAVGFGLVVGGGVGNLVDRFVRSPGPLRGHVVDWLQPRYGNGAMNLADLALTVGVLVIIGTEVVAARRADW